MSGMIDQINNKNSDVKRLAEALAATVHGVGNSHAPYDFIAGDGTLAHDSARCPRCAYKNARLALIDFIHSAVVDHPQANKYPFRALDIREAKQALAAHPRC